MLLDFVRNKPGLPSPNEQDAGVLDVGLRVFPPLLALTVQLPIQYEVRAAARHGNH